MVKQLTAQLNAANNVITKQYQNIIRLENENITMIQLLEDCNIRKEQLEYDNLQCERHLLELQQVLQRYNIQLTQLYEELAKLRQ